MAYLFEKFVLSEENFTLTREGVRIPLEPKSLRVLILLVGSKGKLVSKQALLDAVWSGTFVEETALTRTVTLVRKQLADDPRQPRFIETVPTVGYRFIAPVEERAISVAGTSAAESPAQSAVTPTDSRRWIWTAALALLALGLTAFGIGDAVRIRSAHVETFHSLGSRPSPAYDGYLQGRYLLNKRDFDGALPLFRRAVVLDPNDASAWAGLAVGLAESAMGSPDPLNGPAREAKAAARHALELDPKNGEAWSALGMVAMNWEWDWQGAEQDYRHAVTLSPGDSTTEWRYATYLSLVGRHDEAVAHMKRALQLDPMTFMNVRQMGTVFYWARRYDEAIESYHRAQEMEPDAIGFISSWESKADDMKGLHDRAVAVDFQLTPPEPAGTPESDRAHAKLEAAYQAGGWQGYWEERLRLMQRAPYGECASFDLAADYARIGRIDEAFSWIDRGVSERCFLITSVPTDPIFDGLRADARYPVLLRQLHLGP